jgi:glycosyltransferase involved in cell wall biosynthesis
MNKPFITVVTICKNAESTIERAIQSVISQDYDAYEYIIIDGNSEDRTISVIEKYKDKISSIVSEPDSGISDAFNKGITNAKGDIISLVNADDGLMPGALKSVAENYDENIDVYRGITVLWDEDSGTKFEEMPSMQLRLNGRNHICHQSTFVRKSAYRQVGLFNADYKYAMDFDMLLRLQNAGMRFKFINKPLAFYTLGGRTASKFTKERLNEIERIILSNGGQRRDVLIYRIYRTVANVVKCVVPKRITMKIK